MIVGGTEVVLDDGVHEGTLHLGDHLEDVTITSVDGADAVMKGDDEDTPTSESVGATATPIATPG